MYQFERITDEGFAEITVNTDSDTHVVKSVKCLDGHGREQIVHYTNKDQPIPRKQLSIDMDKLVAARAWADSMR